MRQYQRRAMLWILALHHLGCRMRCSRYNRVAQHVGERRLLAANQQQREQQGKKWTLESAHEARITTQRTQGADQSTCSSRPLR